MPALMVPLHIQMVPTSRVWLVLLTSWGWKLSAWAAA
jgi:hypothetical protein